MTRAHKIEIWITAIVILLLSITTLLIIRWLKAQPLSLRGAVIVQDADPQKQLPIAGVAISADDDLASDQTNTDASGFFALKLRKPVRKGHPIVLHFHHPLYRSFDLTDYVSNHLYVIHLIPLSTSAPQNLPRVKVSNVRIRYTIKTMSEMNVGSAVKTFEVMNKGNVPCKSQRPCSPDGKWKAAVGGTTMDAGVGNEFRDVRASCIAGPCPFTKLEGDSLPQGLQKITVNARDWSDTATFVLEAEVFRSIMSQAAFWSYPVIFGDGLSFTLPSDAESVTIQAELDGQSIIFPLPAVSLSWAACDDIVNPDKAHVYRCTPKPGYRFQ
jgi:hypothetical protein